MVKRHQLVFLMLRERGEWFYSEKYATRWKVLGSILGDYLFHSVPYDENQSQIVDYTLGTPASHGCIA